jgi:ribosome-associated translation inhibitor RaiA
MNTPLEITFRNLDRSDNAVEAIEKRFKQLERFYPRITGTSVMIEMPHKHHRNGNDFHVTIELDLPGKRLVVGHNPDKQARHNALLPTVADAFKTMTRKLEDYARKQRSHAERREQAV